MHVSKESQYSNVFQNSVELLAWLAMFAKEWLFSPYKFRQQNQHKSHLSWDSGPGSVISTKNRCAQCNHTDSSQNTVIAWHNKVWMVMVSSSLLSLSNLLSRIIPIKEIDLGHIRIRDFQRPKWELKIIGILENQLKIFKLWTGKRSLGRYVHVERWDKNILCTL